MSSLSMPSGRFADDVTPEKGFFLSSLLPKTIQGVKKP
ncbi:hypothetical protein ATPR_1133 [Acetobacter tropicalis NBRC 101654]|uniref:Uncharacterized protein n=1 Tax=Acetobacter tropicalis NBRC 101654 TaxID=749388 RepID=F7VCN4_9PROT|nr:hypothetical protein ATPR_1133 [Acetobacter tropicalis NBRC 101654]